MRVKPSQSNTGVLVSVIMPAYQAASSIAKALESLKRQRLGDATMEILVIDGGSSDNTREIANTFGATVLDNPDRQQEYAKHLGMRHAQGRFAIFMDADEVLLNPDSIQERIRCFERHPDLRNLICGGLLTPPGFPRICDYINAIGDPFYYYLGRIDSSQFADSFSKSYPDHTRNDHEMIVRFRDDDLLPVIDAGTHMFDLTFFKSTFPDRFRTPDCVPLIFELMARHTRRLGLLNNDFIHHYSVSTVRDYLRKLKWKIVANIHYPYLPGVGYGNRAQVSRRLGRKRFGFVLYGFSIVLPLYDAAVLAMRKRNPAFLLHAWFCMYTLFTVAWQFGLKAIGIRPRLPAYGK